ncbi:hypothetical protein SacmaDRAFT_5003 [Saccharomonospora marina XMU15]|uniref:Uncharacterized protein n=1 Tax=Saccharomonospora marina XMU15 TaxID=882083 RepID=H5X243_9PSEU|nr:hypothetical protein [Saccharomonospora marina]EHR53172.1 hypothetical protein SacmaDRAFT_5003 [Saccharomonospora marina XMU15]
MRRRLPRTLALPVTTAVLLLSAVPAAGQTTPPPEPADPGQAPISSPPNPMPTGKAIGEAGTALGMLRLLPQAVPTSSVMPGMDDELPKQSALEGGFGISSARANSGAYLTYERSIAEATPAGLSVAGNAPQAPGALAQTALPDNPRPRSVGFTAPENPLLNLSGLNGRVHARWSPTMGPCVGTIADASTSVASISMLNVVPTMPDASQLTAGSERLRSALGSLPGPLAELGGLLSGGGKAKPNADGTGSVLSMPNTLATRSVVRLVDMPGSDRLAVESTSTMQAADINILKGTPLGLTIKVVSQPTLRVTSTGDEKTSKVEYTAPVLAVERGGEKLFELDAAHPTKDVPIGVPLPGLDTLPGFEKVKGTPVIGGVAELADGGLRQLTGKATGFVLDVGVLRLSIADLVKKGSYSTEPFEGYQLGASARMLDLRILPTEALKQAMPADLAEKLPSSLAQLSLGEQIVRAYAPAGGVECSTTAPPAPPPAGGGEQPGVPDRLAQTSAAYSSVPLFWTGTAMLLIGVVLVAGLPTRRREEPAGVKPSPRPREE